MKFKINSSALALVFKRSSKRNEGHQRWFYGNPSSCLEDWRTWAPESRGMISHFGGNWKDRALWEAHLRAGESGVLEAWAKWRVLLLRPLSIASRSSKYLQEKIIITANKGDGEPRCSSCGHIDPQSSSCSTGPESWMTIFLIDRSLKTGTSALQEVNSAFALQLILQTGEIDSLPEFNKISTMLLNKFAPSRQGTQLSSH